MAGGHGSWDLVEDAPLHFIIFQFNFGPSHVGVPLSLFAYIVAFNAEVPCQSLFVIAFFFRLVSMTCFERVNLIVLAGSAITHNQVFRFGPPFTGLKHFNSGCVDG